MSTETKIRCSRCGGTGLLDQDTGHPVDPSKALFINAVNCSCCFDDFPDSCSKCGRTDMKTLCADCEWLCENCCECPNSEDDSYG